MGLNNNTSYGGLFNRDDDLYHAKTSSDIINETPEQREANFRSTKQMNKLLIAAIFAVIIIFIVVIVFVNPHKKTTDLAELLNLNDSGLTCVEMNVIDIRKPIESYVTRDAKSLEKIEAYLRKPELSPAGNSERSEIGLEGMETYSVLFVLDGMKNASECPRIEFDNSGNVFYLSDGITKSGKLYTADAEKMTKLKDMLLQSER